MKVPEPISIPEIIDLLGGPTLVARTIGVPSTTVSNWKGRGSIPARYHGRLTRMSKGKVTLAMLMQAIEPPTLREPSPVQAAE
jgi:DNA-binding transcriptional regulator YdaS (Cro superfamily)